MFDVCYRRILTQYQIHFELTFKFFIKRSSLSSGLSFIGGIFSNETESDLCGV